MFAAKLLPLFGAMSDEPIIHDVGIARVSGFDPRSLASDFPVSVRPG